MAKEKEYEVIGACRVHGHAPGETFHANLAPHEEDLLVQAGHIRRVRGKLEKAVEPQPVETATAKD